MLSKNLTKIILLVLFSLFLFGCGEGAGGSSDSNNTVIQVQDPLVSGMTYDKLYSLAENQSSPGGLLVSAHSVGGLTIQCGSENITTLLYKPFTCKNFPITISLGNFKIGTLSKETKDKIVFIQDILGIPRAATMHPSVVKLSMLLQSLDEDGDISNGIEITTNTLNLLNPNLSNFSNITQLTFEDVNNIIDDVIASRKLIDSDTKLKKITNVEAQTNLIEAVANIPVFELNNSIFTNLSL